MDEKLVDAVHSAPVRSGGVEGDGWDHGEEEEEEDKHELWDPHTQTHKSTSRAGTQS
jgi:hypothetical protein